MSDFDQVKQLVANLSVQLTEERMAEVRSLSGIGCLPPGSLTQIVEDQPFSIEDIVTVLLSGWILQTEEIKLNLERISELEDLFSLQKRSIDGIADQTTRLRVLLSSLSQDENPVSPVDMLKHIAARAGNDGAVDPG